MLHYGRIIFLLLTLLASVLGFTSVNNGLLVGATPIAKYSAIDTPRFEVSLHRERLAFAGHTASERQERRLWQSADRFFSVARKSARFKPLGTAPDYWASASVALLETLVATRSAHGLLTDGSLRIRGVSTGGWNEAQLRLRAALPEFIELDVDMIIADARVSSDDLCARAFARQRSGAINFEESTTVLRSSAKPALDRIISLADACCRSTIRITGHTDSSGPEAWNLELSLARANAVADYLANGGIARERLATSGAGSSLPVASNVSRYGRSRNRRIDIDFEPGR